MENGNGIDGFLNETEIIVTINLLEETGKMFTSLINKLKN